MSKGLTYFRLNSPYDGDITKNCALDGLEVDGNFFTLEGRDIQSVTVEGDKIAVTLVNGNVIKSGDVFSNFAQNLNIEFDAEKGILYVTQNGFTKKIEGFVTVFSNEHGVSTDSTLTGNGKPSKPLGISPMYKTGTYVPVKKIIDTVATDEKLPCGKGLLPGDRFLVYTQNSDYGFLYDYENVKKIACDLVGSHSEWRIPTKEDWDDMLNAVEPCEADRDHESASSNKYLGKWAGKFLKSFELWKPERGCCPPQNEGDNVTCINYPDAPQYPQYGCVNNCDCQPQEDPCAPNYCGEHHHIPFPPKPDGARGIDKYGFWVTPPGYADDGNMYGYFKERCWYWTATNSRSGASAYTKRFEYDRSNVYQDITPTRFHLSLRLVKDYNGNNYYERENILSGNFPTVLMPSIKSGQKVWTKVNIDFGNRCYNPMLPNDGQGMTLTKKYYIYEWDGHKWLANELREGETVVVLKAPHGRYSAAYKIINGDLINVDVRMTNEILRLIDPRLHGLEHLIHEEKERAEAAEAAIIADLDATKIRLDEEITARTEADEAITASLNQEIADRTAADEALSQAIQDEAAARTAADEALNQAIQDEATARAEKDAELEQKIEALEEADVIINARIDQEIADRTAADEALDEKINQEIADRTAADEALGQRIDQEIEDRTAADIALGERIDQEIEDRTAADIALGERIDAEAEAREAKDTEIEGQLHVAEGSEFDAETGILTLKSKAGTNDLNIQFRFNFGEI